MSELTIGGLRALIAQLPDDAAIVVQSSEYGTSHQIEARVDHADSLFYYPTTAKRLAPPLHNSAVLVIVDNEH